MFGRYAKNGFFTKTYFYVWFFKSINSYPTTLFVNRVKNYISLWNVKGTFLTICLTQYLQVKFYSLSELHKKSMQKCWRDTGGLGPNRYKLHVNRESRVGFSKWICICIWYVYVLSTRLKCSLWPLDKEINLIRSKCHQVREDYRTSGYCWETDSFCISISNNFAIIFILIFISLSCLVFYLHSHTYINRHMHSQIFMHVQIIHSCTQKENRIHADIRLLKTVRGVWGKILKTSVKQQNKHVDRQPSLSKCCLGPKVEV
jgi:hypothetical protein